jgi:imidazolonepropionase
MQTLITNIKGLLQVRETNVDKVSGAEMASCPPSKTLTCY